MPVCTKPDRSGQAVQHHRLARCDGGSAVCAGEALILPYKCTADEQAPAHLSEHGPGLSIILSSGEDYADSPRARAAHLSRAAPIARWRESPGQMRRPTEPRFQEWACRVSCVMCLHDTCAKGAASTWVKCSCRGHPPHALGRGAGTHRAARDKAEVAWASASATRKTLVTLMPCKGYHQRRRESVPK